MREKKKKQTNNIWQKRSDFFFRYCIERIIPKYISHQTKIMRHNHKRKVLSDVHTSASNQIFARIFSKLWWWFDVSWKKKQADENETANEKRTIMKRSSDGDNGYNDIALDSIRLIFAAHEIIILLFCSFFVLSWFLAKYWPPQKRRQSKSTQ